MAANTRVATAVQILCVIAYRGPLGANSEIISRSLLTNPVVVRRLLKCMEQKGLVELRPGKDGGVQLKRDPDKITLDQIYQAVEDEPNVFALRPKEILSAQSTPEWRPCSVPIFGATDAAVNKMLKQRTLGSLVKAIP